MKSACRVFLAGVCLGSSHLLAAQDEDGSGWCRNRQLYAVPAPSALTIDGRLDDWDLSGAIQSYVMAETRENQNAVFALMYDEEALYIGCVVRDPTPLMNHRDPKTEGDKGWDGDALQFRICVDPAQGYPVTDASWETQHNLALVHLTMWYYTERQEPVLVAQTGMDYQTTPGSEKFGVIPKDRFQARYRLSEDQREYALEYRIPWSTLMARQPPKGGDLVAGAMQVLWGKAGNEHIGVNGVTYDIQNPGGFAYQNAAVWGKVIFSKSGNLPKELVRVGLPRERPLPLTFEYDLPESGEVTLQLVNATNEVVRIIAGEASRLAGRNIERWDGLDSLGRPLAAGNYTWKGLYHQPITTRHVLSVENSGLPPWKNDDNTGGWGGDHGGPCGACAAGNDIILSWISAEAGYGLIRVDAEGRKKWGALRSWISQMASDGERLYVATGFDDDERMHPYGLECQGIELLSAKDFRPLSFGNGATLIPPPASGAAAGQVGPVITGLAVAKGTLYASWRKLNLVVSYDATQGDRKASWDVPAPGGLAARPDGAIVLTSGNTLSLLKDGKLTALAAEHLDEPKGVALDAAGNIHVANHGRLQNVSVFSPEGTYLKSIGKAGGRASIGAYDPSGMLSPKGVAVDPQGKLWVAEAAEAPKRVSVWNCQNGMLEKEFFGCAHYSASICMDPERGDEVYCDNVLWKVDLDKQSWYPKSTVWRPSNPNSPGLFATHGGGLTLFTARNGKQYGWGRDEHYGTVLSVREGDIMKPLLMFFWTWSAKQIGYPVTADTARFPDGGTYIWVDGNNDQILQEGEVTAVAKLSPECARRYFRGFSAVDKDLNLWHERGAVNRPLRILPDGRPEYDFAKPAPLPVVETRFVDDAGALYTLTQDDSKPERIGYGKWSQDGKLQWGMAGFANWPKALNYPSQKPGKLWGPTMLLGTAGGYTGFNTYFGVAHLYTEDGLFVSRILKDVRTVVGKLGADVISCENMNGCLVQPKGSDRFFFLGGDQDGRVTEILGLETVRRLKGGVFVISEADARKVAAEFEAYHTTLSQAQKLGIGHGLQSLATTKPVVRTLDPKRSFEAQAAYDDKNLYLKYQVTSPAKLVNGIPDQTIIFKGGNLIDIQLAGDPKAAANRKTPVPGDIRILVSRRNDKSVAVLFRPKVAGFTGTPVVLKSPVAQESFDAIEPSDGIALEYIEDKGRPSFTALVTVPLELIGLKPAQGMRLKMDLGYIYGNSEGTKAIVRSYWTNNGFSANVLNDIPSESRLEPVHWGEAEME